MLGIHLTDAPTNQPQTTAKGEILKISETPYKALITLVYKFGIEVFESVDK